MATSHSTLFKNIVLTVLIILYTPVLFAQNKSGESIDGIRGVFQTMIEQGRFINDLQDIGSGEAYNLPIGLQKNIGNTPFMLAVTNIKMGPQYGEISLLMKMSIPQESKELLFGASGIKISHDGDLIGDVKLALLNEIPISLGNLGDVIIKGSIDKKSGNHTSDTYVSLECNGDFKELSIDADIILNPNTFVLASDTLQPVKSSFRTAIHDWNDWIVKLSFPTFWIKGAEGFDFTLTNAVLDLSDTRNPSTFNPDPSYMANYFTLPNPSLWRGLYVDEFSIAFPEWFKNKDSNEKVRLGASHLLIDENGITGDIFGENVLSIEHGDASGWAFSVQSFQLSFLANNLKKFGFGGQIDVPLSSKIQLFDYKAYISKNEYLFKVEVRDSLDFHLFGDTKLFLDSTSYLMMELRNKQFRPKVVLNGSMGVDIDGLKMEQLTFSKLTIATESPVFSVESLGYGGEVKLYNFPITISDIQFQMANDVASLGFQLKINLMKQNIGADSRLTLASEYKGRQWSFKGMSIDAIRLENVQLAGFSLDGEIRLGKNDPVYGNYFGGTIDATFGALSNALTIKATSVFGCKEFRYWYAEGQAIFQQGIPIGPVSLNGFTGGAYYRMSATGGKGLQAYAPNGDCSLGLKAGVSYFVGSKTLVNGDALFEMNFLSGGGIKNIRFYGSAEFMMAMDLTNKLGKLEDMYKKAQSKLGDISASFSEKVQKKLSGSEVAEEVTVDLKLSGNVSAYVTMDFDFPTKTFDADFKVMINVAGGLLKGAGNNNEAGWAKLYLSPQTWYVHVGTPKNPVGIKLGLGPLSLKSESYFMLGDKLENPLPPPRNALNILGITGEQADYMKYPADMKAGRGLGFGSRFEFDTGDITFLILYARFMAGTGFDIMLRDMSNYACEGSRKPVGINGWYANGQCYAYLQGELGVKIKLFFINKKITVIKGSTAALLQARLPNPTWIGGHLAVNLNVLGGLIKASMKLKMSFGNDCKLVSLNGDYSPIDLPMIADLTPPNNDTDVDVFISPQATFNMPIGEPFDIENENGDVKTYRIMLEKFYVLDNENKEIIGSIKMNRKNDAATFESKEILPPNQNMKAYVSVNFQERSGNNWNTVSQGGNVARESRTVSFKTGTAPNNIPLNNIAYCYPVIDQRNLYKGESQTGYVQLIKGQTYLFLDNFNYDAIFAGGGRSVKANFRYSSSDSRLNYSIPSLRTKTEYEVSFIASTSGNQNNPAGVIKTSATIQDAEGEAFSIDYMQQAAREIIKQGQLEILKYKFRSSEYETFERKMSKLKFNTGSRYVSSEIRSLLLSSSSNYELFDEAELVGNAYTSGMPLVVAEAVLDDDYFKKDIAPLIYNGYPISGLRITGRDVNIYGVPPSKAYHLYDGYLNYIYSNSYNDVMSKIWPFVYELTYYYASDYYELKTKASNMFDKGINMNRLKPLVESKFFFIRPGKYKTVFRYMLPGGKQGTSRQLNYEWK